MQKLTFDNNCLIAVENHEPVACEIEKLVRAHQLSLAQVSLLGISASERQTGGGYISNIGDFLKRLELVGMAELGIHKPIAVWDITFWDWSVYAADEDVELQKDIHELMFPTIDRSWATYAGNVGESVNSKDGPGYRKWRNRHCDVQGLWAHIKNKGDVLVTSDSHFLQNTAGLTVLGARCILTPGEAAKLFPNV